MDDLTIDKMFPEPEPEHTGWVMRDLFGRDDEDGFTLDPLPFKVLWWEHPETGEIMLSTGVKRKHTDKQPSPDDDQQEPLELVWRKNPMQIDGKEVVLRDEFQRHNPIPQQWLDELNCWPESLAEYEQTQRDAIEQIRQRREERGQ